jgi:polar amino acid transport system substrate-binding protein
MTTVGYGDKAPVTLWGRMLALVWMFASIILISTFYGGDRELAHVVAALDLSAGSGDLGHARVGVIEGRLQKDYCRDNNISPVRIADLNQALQRVEEGQLDALVYDAGHYAV